MDSIRESVRTTADPPALLRPRQLRASASAALASLLGRQELLAAPRTEPAACPGSPHFPPKAKRVIYLFQSGGPSQLDLFDYKPQLEKLHGQRPARLDPHGPAAHRHDRGAGDVPGRAVDVQVRAARQDAARGSASCCRTPRRSSTTSCFIKSLHTEPINHDPAITFIQTGCQLAGRPSIGAWVAYGLGSENQDLPGVRRDDLAEARGDSATSRSPTGCGAAASCRRATRA